MKCCSKFDKNKVALRFKDLHIVPWIHQKIMLPLSFLEFNFAKWDTEKIIGDQILTWFILTAVFNSFEP